MGELKTDIEIYEEFSDECLKNNCQSEKVVTLMAIEFASKQAWEFACLCFKETYEDSEVFDLFEGYLEKLQKTK